MRRLARGALVAASVASAACGAPELGDLPARCSDGVCPEGYACIHEVCARPGAEVPATVARLDALRDVDLKLVPQGSSALVVWPSSTLGAASETFSGARVTTAGDVGEPMAFATGFEANEAPEAPSYDVVALPDDRVLLAVGASPLPADRDPAMRMMAFRVRLPPEGDEARGAQVEAAWPSEQRLETAGRGAACRPKLLPRGDGRVDLGYVRSSRRAEADGKPQTIAELAIAPLGEDGAFAGDARFYRVRRGMSVAVAAVDAFSLEGAAWWVLDDIRPTAVLVADQGMYGETPILGRFGTAVAADAHSITYIDPSDRMGNKLAASPVSGAAALRRVWASPIAGGRGWTFTDLPVADFGEVRLRDTPRPVWIFRRGRPPLLVTPGADIDASALLVYQVEPADGHLALVRRIERLSSTRIGATRALVAHGKLFVAWVDATDAGSTIRMAVVPEP